ncbi:MAG: peptide/nickel transport system permease protein [Tepidanaerobacteraceae bacterium]|nr:peptide/nickel transport system permease protein [Tepidanaerobacteraceae bacterium]
MQTKKSINNTAPVKSKRMSEGRSLWMDAWLRLRKNKSATFGLTLVIIICLAAIFAPYITRYDPYKQLIWTEGIKAKLAPPSAEHWFGTDVYGRDIYTRVVYGARISLQIGFAATGMSVIIGVVLGSLAGYYGGFIDDFISWLTNVVFAFPFLLFVLALVAYLPPSLPLMYSAIGVVSWASFARVARGQVMQVKRNEYVEAATAVGGGDSRILFRHILPNILAPIIVQATLEMGSIILLESSLSFLGFGVQPPKPAWGFMISEGKQFFLSGQWWWSVFPGIAIMVLVLGFNLFGDGLRDALDPRLKQ